MLFVFYLLVIPFFTFLTSEALCEAPSDELTLSYLTELTLKNGMKICLKQSQLESGECEFKLVAMGGYTSLPTSEHKSAWLATEIAWESGIDSLDGDQFKCTLDDHSIELGSKIAPFDRTIEGSCPASEMPYCLHLIKLLFTKPQFTEVGLKNALTNARHRMQQKAKAGQYENDLFIKTNLKNWYVVKPFNAFDLSQIELSKSEKIFKNFFSNPAEFILIIVGDFKKESIISSLEETLGFLPPKPVTKWQAPTPPPFPDGITKKEFSGFSRYRESLTRITFPLSSKLTEPNMAELLCLILEHRLQNQEEGNKIKWKKEVKLSHQYPLFPILDPLWLVLTYQSPISEVHSINQSILKTLKSIKQNGLTEIEIKRAIQKLRRNKFPAPDNSYELSLLANYYQAGRNVSNLYQWFDQNKDEKIILKKLIECYPNLNQYSIITFHP